MTKDETIQDLVSVLQNAITSISIMSMPIGQNVASNEQMLEIMKQSFKQALERMRG